MIVTPFYNPHPRGNKINGRSESMKMIPETGRSSPLNPRSSIEINFYLVPVGGPVCGISPWAYWPSEVALGSSLNYSLCVTWSSWAFLWSQLDGGPSPESVLIVGRLSDRTHACDSRVIRTSKSLIYTRNRSDSRALGLPPSRRGRLV